MSISEIFNLQTPIKINFNFRAETRRGKESVNRHWDACRSTYAGDYILAVGSKILAQIRHEEVLIVLAQVLADLVRGEFQQLQNKSESSERFQLYLAKTFNKTASLIAYRYYLYLLIYGPIGSGFSVMNCTIRKIHF